MILRCYKLLTIALLLSCCLSRAASAYIIASFNSARLTENAELVCKVQVLSLKQDGIVKGNFLVPPFQDTPKMIASAKVLSVIKGESPDVFNIEYYGAAGGADNTPSSEFIQLKQGEICLVFLRKEGMSYKFYDLHNGKLGVQPQVIEHKMDATPLARLLSELIVSAESGEGLIKLQAIKEIGAWGEVSRRKLLRGGYSVKDDVLGESQAREVLRELRSAKDIRVRGLAAMASLQIGDSPGVAGAMSLFMPVTETGQQPTDKQSKDVYSIPMLQERFVQAVDDSTRTFLQDANGRVIHGHNGTPTRGVSGFDYAEFCKQALHSKAVKHSEEMRKHIANTMWIMEDAKNIPDAISLLNDSNLYIRYVAVEFLRNTVSKDDSQFVWEIYQKEEPRHLEYWKKWWEANKNQLKATSNKSSPASQTRTQQGAAPDRLQPTLVPRCGLCASGDG